VSAEVAVSKTASHQNEWVEPAWVGLEVDQGLPTFYWKYWAPVSGDAEMLAVCLEAVSRPGLVRTNLLPSAGREDLTAPEVKCVH